MAELGTGLLDDAYLRLKDKRGDLDDVRRLVGAGLLAPVRRYGGHISNSIDAVRLIAREPPWRAMTSEAWRDIRQSGDIGRLLDAPIESIQLLLPAHDRELDLAVRRISSAGGWVYLRDMHRELPGKVSARITLPQRPRRTGPRPPQQPSAQFTDGAASHCASSSNHRQPRVSRRIDSSVPWADDLSSLTYAYVRPYGTVYHSDPECPSLFAGQTWGKSGTIPERGEPMLRTRAEATGRSPCQRCYPRAWLDEGRDISRG